MLLLKPLRRVLAMSEAFHEFLGITSEHKDFLRKHHFCITKEITIKLTHWE